MVAQVGSIEIDLLARTAEFQSDLRRATSSIERFASESRRSVGAASNALRSLRNTAAGVVAGYVSIQGAMAVASRATAGFNSLIESNAQFGNLSAALETVEGSAEAASEAFSRLQDFAKTTPFELDQSVQAFIRLRTLGLDASEKSMRAFGNTASAFGKSMIDYIEAVADASTFEFERLKEFGIKVRQEQDSLTVNFRGNTYNLKKDAETITQFLTMIGEADFAGAMDRQMQRLGGKLSNLSDSFQTLKINIGEGGFTSAVGDAADRLSGFLGELSTTDAPRQFGAALGESIRAGSEAIIKLAETFAPKLIAGIERASSAIGDFAKDKSKIDSITASVDLLADALGAMGRQALTAGGFLGEMAASYAQLFQAGGLADGMRAVDQATKNYVQPYVRSKMKRSTFGLMDDAIDEAMDTSKLYGPPAPATMNAAERTEYENTKRQPSFMELLKRNLGLPDDLFQGWFGGSGGSGNGGNGGNGNERSASNPSANTTTAPMVAFGYGFGAPPVIQSSSNPQQQSIRDAIAEDRRIQQLTAMTDEAFPTASGDLLRGNLDSLIADIQTAQQAADSLAATAAQAQAGNLAMQPQQLTPELFGSLSGGGTSNGAASNGAASSGAASRASVTPPAQASITPKASSLQFDYTNAKQLAVADIQQSQRAYQEFFNEIQGEYQDLQLEFRRLTESGVSVRIAEIQRESEKQVEQFRRRAIAYAENETTTSQQAQKIWDETSKAVEQIRINSEREITKALADERQKQLDDARQKLEEEKRIREEEARQKEQEEQDKRSKILASNDFGAGFNQYFRDMKKDLYSLAEAGHETASRIHDAFQSSLSDGLFAAFTGRIDSMRTLFQGFANSIIRIYADIAAKILAQKIMLATGTMTTTAAEAATASAAWSAPAALASLATLGANAGPAMAGIASTVTATRAMSFAEGGVIGKPTLAVIGDNPRASEAVLPLNEQGVGKIVDAFEDQGFGSSGNRNGNQGGSGRSPGNRPQVIQINHPVFWNQQEFAATMDRISRIAIYDEIESDGPLRQMLKMGVD